MINPTAQTMKQYQQKARKIIEDNILSNKKAPRKIDAFC